MKNLFEYAKHELSQDAFLRWLFESYGYESDGLGEISRSYLSFLTNKEINKDDIKKIETFVQKEHIDLMVEVVNINNDKYCIYIEDKILSDEHNEQLKRYNDII